jgi:hypothetical protein
MIKRFININTLEIGMVSSCIIFAATGILNKVVIGEMNGYIISAAIGMQYKDLNISKWHLSFT